MHTAIYENYKNNTPLPFVPCYSDEYNNIRRLKLIVFSHTLKKYPEFDNLNYNNQINILMSIENSFINEAIRKSKDNNERCIWTNIQFINIYHDVCFRVISILDQCNKDLINKIINDNEFTNNIARIPSKELIPEKYADITHNVNKRVNIEQTIKFTEMYFCKKCKRNQTTAERVQNRSNDESSSFYITCLFCGT